MWLFWYNNISSSRLMRTCKSCRRRHVPKESRHLSKHKEESSLRSWIDFYSSVECVHYPALLVKANALEMKQNSIPFAPTSFQYPIPTLPPNVPNVNIPSVPSFLNAIPPEYTNSRPINLVNPIPLSYPSPYGIPILQAPPPSLYPTFNSPPTCENAGYTKTNNPIVKEEIGGNIAQSKLLCYRHM